ncbi:MAG: flagellin lysine-N-methylase [Tepidibacter sp.]|uniref:flagellin lysine-N-methylase n=1 Tax=Tepidibacter sp. TaxID=2529387 RepID=UPI0025E80C8B|nr:flagellin lysine-N-methylase [Tepidibacter sp.]MCT4508867.1 flagellin lysine-N-methylase [Tepidibacter sp.]
MSDKKQRKVLIPQYMNQFRCIGSECEDTCCVGWNIEIDKNTYKKYRNCNNKNLKAKLKDKVKRNRSNTSEFDYAKIKLNEHGSCPFLDDNKLCSIQSSLGEEYLSLACTIYPRNPNKLNNSFEKSGSISCPEVARLALLNPKKMEFDEIYEDIKPRHITKRSLHNNKFTEHFWKFRIFTISLLQNRNFKLWERLIILGLFYEKVEEYIKENKSNDIPNLIAKYTSMIDNGVFDGMLDNIPTQTTLQMKILKELIDEAIYKGVRSKRYIECLKECLYGIGYVKGTDIEKIG